MIKAEGGSIVHVDEMGLKQLAYQIKKRSTAVYYCVEFQMEAGPFVDKLELALRRDERIMRFLTVGLDKYAIKYNADKRNGLIGKVSKKEKKEDTRGNDRRRSSNSKPAPKPAPKPAEAAKPAPAPEPTPAPAPVAETSTAVAEAPKADSSSSEEE